MASVPEKLLRSFQKQTNKSIHFTAPLGTLFKHTLKCHTHFASNAINSERKTEKEILHCTIMGKGNDAASSPSP